MPQAPNVLPFPKLHDISNSQPAIGSLLDSGCVDDINIKHAIEHNPKQFTGKNWISVRTFPDYLLFTVEEFRRTIASPAKGHRHGLNTVLSGCIYNGLKMMAHNPMISKLRDLREALFEVRNPAYKPYIVELNRWFKTFRLDLKSGTDSCISIGTPNHIKIKVEETARELGVTKTDIVLLSIMLSMQTECETFKEDINKTIERAHRAIDLRVQMSEALLNQVATSKAKREMINTS